jgi:chemotaxis protein MotB
MKKYVSIFLIFQTIISCIPPGKLSEALDANTILYKKYDSINKKLNDTVVNYANSVNLLKNNVKRLNDSISYYRVLASAPKVLTEGDIFLNQMLDLSLISKSELAAINSVSSFNINKSSWLDAFKATLKTFTGTEAEVKLNKGFIYIEISDKLLFKSGSQSLSTKSQNVLKNLAQLLQAQPELIFMIEGHTDNKNFKGKDLNDNWNLSVQRATAVARILQTKYKIDPKRIITAGRSQYMPVEDNYTKEGRQKNRRIRIVLMPSLSQVMNLKLVE